MARTLQEQEINQLFREHLPAAPIPQALAVRLRLRILTIVNADLGVAAGDGEERRPSATEEMI